MRFALYSLKAGERPGVPQATRSPNFLPGRAKVLLKRAYDPQIIYGFPLGPSFVLGALDPTTPTRPSAPLRNLP